jgi:chromosome partitioning protein
MSTSDLAQLAGAIGGLLGAIFGAVLWLVRRHFKELQSTIRQLKSQVAHLEESCQDLRNKKSRLENEKTRLESECAHQQAEIKKLTDDRDEARRQFQQVADQAEHLRAENADLRANRTLWQGQLAALNGKLEQQDSQIKSITQERDNLRQEREQLRTELTTSKVQQERAAEQAEHLEKELDRRLAEYQRLVADRAKKLRQLAGQLKAEQERVQEERDRAERAELASDELNKQIDQIVRQDERVWERPVSGIPFQPLFLRRVPIIAILNFKGGVGKTTITANLAGMMAEQHKKVLVIDADYQRNLSMLLMPNKERITLHHQKRTFQHFLIGSDHGLSRLLQTAAEVPGSAGCHIVTNSDLLRADRDGEVSALGDSLEDVEMRLMAEWMLRPTVADARLALREALHDVYLQQHGYRYILIDCPPRLSTACVNALAASDFILVPILLDATSARSFPHLLRTLRRLRSEKIFPQLQFLGVLANGVSLRNREPIAQQKETWNNLAPFRSLWGSDVYQFEIKIPHSQRFADAAGSAIEQSKGPALAIRDGEIKRIFAALLQEIEGRIDHASQRYATVSS